MKEHINAKSLLFATLMLLAMAHQTFAGLVVVRTNQAPQVTLAWDADTTGQVSSYNIYTGDASGSYTNMALTTNNTIALTLPARSVTFFFAAQSVATNGLVSLLSSEVSYRAPAAPTPPTMHNVVTLVVQSKSSLQDFQWVDTDMAWSVDPLASSFYSLRVEPGVLVPTPVIRVRPPMPPAPL